MAMETFIVFAASYDTLGAAEADYHAVYDFYLTSGLLDTYDAAVITKDDAGQVRIVIKHEQPARQGAWRGLGIGLIASALDEGHSGLVVVADSDLGDLGEHVIRRASRLTRQPPDQSLQQAVADSEAAVREAERQARAAVREAEREAERGAEAAVREAEREAQAAVAEAERYSAFGSRPAPRSDLASQLDDLARLRDKGALSQAEFEAAKARLLDG